MALTASLGMLLGSAAPGRTRLAFATLILISLITPLECSPDPPPWLLWPPFLPASACCSEVPPRVEPDDDWLP